MCTLAIFHWAYHTGKGVPVKAALPEGQAPRTTLAGAGELSEGTVVQKFQPSFDGSIRFCQAEEGVMCRKPARMNLCTNWTPASTLALSRGLRTRAGMTAVP